MRSTNSSVAPTIPSCRSPSARAAGQVAGERGAAKYIVRVSESSREKAGSLCTQLRAAGGACIVCAIHRATPAARLSVPAQRRLPGHQYLEMANAVAIAQVPRQGKVSLSRRDCYQPGDRAQARGQISYLPSCHEGARFAAAAIWPLPIDPEPRPRPHGGGSSLVPTKSVTRQGQRPIDAP